MYMTSKLLRRCNERARLSLDAHFDEVVRRSTHSSRYFRKRQDLRQVANLRLYVRLFWDTSPPKEETSTSQHFLGGRISVRSRTRKRAQYIYIPFYAPNMHPFLCESNTNSVYAAIDLSRCQYVL